jgi:prepilin-type processing-associated H-X9-DG protein
MRSGPYSYTFNYPGYPAISWQAYAADYTPLAGVSSALVGYLGLSPNSTGGALQADVPTPILSITDGTSNTILLAEVAGKNDWWANGRKMGQLSGFYGGEGGWADATSAGSALYGSSGDGMVFPGSCGINCSNDFGLYGFHSTGANILLADGSARFVSASTDIRVLAALVTRAGGETVGDY